ncbi:hypothetical protein [Sedimentitalea sp.]|uniref:hypothetical protein n=1 Tax=Sedimentitalea sp. TaxID=2048915 RepID=UPI0032967C87
MAYTLKKMTVVALLLASPAIAEISAANLKEAVSQATAACLSGTQPAFPQKSKIRELLKQAKEKDIVGELDDMLASDEVSECLNLGMPNTEFVWRSDAEQFLSDRSYQGWLRQQTEAALEAAREEQKRREAAKQIELANRVVYACRKLENRDPVAAYTNEICIDVFREGDLPNWDNN